VQVGPGLLPCPGGGFSVVVLQVFVPEIIL
jgi:hypothetical protein